MSTGKQSTLKQLFRDYQRIQVPMIQRDYAQGRAAAVEVRREFLNALSDSLLKPADDPTLPLNLDFIYGSVVGGQESRFLPLDGQQRLTTLFLLHWFLAWQDDAWDEFASVFQAQQQSRFSYGVRPSSNEFFDALVHYRPDSRPEMVSTIADLIGDQPWYYRSWRLDPTIQSVLNMLNAIHVRFATSAGLFSRLMNETQPAITFQLLDLDNFGLSDDLYIKMNARGKPLTPFETFKARYEQTLKSQFGSRTFPIDEQNFPVADYVARRLDNAWADLFWKLRDKKSNLFDSALMNMFRAVALVTRDPESKSYTDDIPQLRSSGPSFGDFDRNDWLDENFTLAIIYLLDAWSANGGTLATLLPDSRYFNEKKIFDQIVSGNVSTTYAELVQFTAYVAFIVKCEGNVDKAAFQEWMRIIKNLSLNSEYRDVDDFRRSIRGVYQLLEQAGTILSHFAGTPKPASGFSEQQITEETVKAALILAHDGWRPLIDRGESHGYFQGQIEFLLDFSLVREADREIAIADWKENTHLEHQDRFADFLRKAEGMFTSSGLSAVPAFLWERALLSIGDYQLAVGKNWSFLIDSATEPTSWKRYLRGSSNRNILRDLWNQIDADQNMPAQLRQIVANANVPDEWRAAFVKTPEAIGYCGNRLIRWEDRQTVYLLQKTQMNGAHAELFTYCFYVNTLKKLNQKGRLTPLKLGEYSSQIGIDLVPCIYLLFTYDDENLWFRITHEIGQFRIEIRSALVESHSAIQSILTEELGFVEDGTQMYRLTTPALVEGTVLDLAEKLLALLKDAVIDEI